MNHFTPVAALCLLVTLTHTAPSLQAISESQFSDPKLRTRTCGAQLVERVQNLCGTCTTDHDLESFACPTPRSDAELIAECCPRRLVQQYIDRKRVCGTRLLLLIRSICPDGCNENADPSLSTVACATRVSEDFVAQSCCPKK